MKRLLALTVALAGCSTTYEKTALKSWDMMASGEAEEAVKTYEEKVTSDKEKLLKFMDEGILLRVAGKYRESNEKFFEAAKIIEASGYLSLGEQGLTLLTNEKQTTYQGEDFEKVLIHVYLGLNFMQLGEWDSALVETRRVNEILFKMISEAKRPYELNAFARYVGAALFEREGDENDAFVDYKNVLRIDPTLKTRFPIIAQDLMRMAKRLGFGQELEEYQKEFGKAEWEKAQKSLKEKAGSLVLILESGKSPQKFSSREQHYTRREGARGGTVVEVLLPVAYYKERATRIHSASLEVGGVQAQTAVLNDIEHTAIQHLKDRMGRAIAKALLTAGVKAGIATGIGKATDSAELGLLAGLALFITSEADTRSWLLLPGELQVAKAFLAPGKYSVSLVYKNEYGGTVRTEEISNIEIKADRPTFIQRRVFE